VAGPGSTNFALLHKTWYQRFFEEFNDNLQAFYQAKVDKEITLWTGGSGAYGLYKSLQRNKMIQSEFECKGIFDYRADRRNRSERKAQRGFNLGSHYCVDYIVRNCQEYSHSLEPAISIPIWLIGMRTRSDISLAQVNICRGMHRADVAILLILFTFVNWLLISPHREPIIPGRIRITTRFVAFNRYLLRPGILVTPFRHPGHDLKPQNKTTDSLTSNHYFVS